MKKSKRIISFLAALAVSSSFVSCNSNKGDSSQPAEELQPEVTEVAEPVAEPEEKGNEYKLTCYYEEQPLADISGLTGSVTDILYGGSHMYYLTDDVTYTSGSGYRMCNIDVATMQRTDLYNAPDGFVYTPANPADLPEGVSLGENDRLFTIFTDRILYGNEKGVCVKDIKTGTERVIDRAGSTDLDVLGAFFDGKKYIIVYQEKPQTLKHFYAAGAGGEVTEETKMTLGFTGHIEKAFVNAQGDLYFAKVERTGGTAPAAAASLTPGAAAPASPAPVTPAASESTKIELYRMKPDGTLSRMVGGEKVAFNVDIEDLFVSDDGNIFIIENDPVNGRTVQRFDSYGIRTARITLHDENSFEDDRYFCCGDQLWRAFTDADGSVSLVHITDDGLLENSGKITTEIGKVTAKLAGDGVYDAYLSDRSGIYGVKITEDKVEELMQWTDADVDTSDLTCLGIREAGDIYCLTTELVPVEEPVLTEEPVVTEETPAPVPEEDTDGEENTDEEDETDSDEDEEDESDEDEDTEEDTEDTDEDGEEETSDEDEEETEPEKSAPEMKEITKPVRLVKADAQRLADINSKRIITVAGDIYADFTVNGVDIDLLSKIKEFNNTSDQYFIHPRNYAKFGEGSLVPEDEDEENTDTEDEDTDDEETDAETEEDEDEAEDDEDEDDEEDEEVTEETEETAPEPASSVPAKISGMQKLEQDMMNGFTPDFIIYDPSDYDFSKYAEEGKFAEIRDLMRDDPEIKETDFLENITELCIKNEVMYRIFPVFKGRTFVVDESEADGKDHWKLDEFLETAGVSNTAYVNEEDALDAVLPAYLIDHTDFAEGTCKFDTKVFRKLIQWADAFPTVEESPSVSYDDSRLYPVRADVLSTPFRFAYEEAAMDDELVIKGMPADEELELEVEPGVCFSVLKTSDAKAEAWKFMRQFFTDDFYGWGVNKGFTEEEIKGHIGTKTLPVRKSVLENLINDSTSLRFETMLNGNDYTPVAYTSWGEEYEVKVKSSASDKFKKAVTGRAYISPKNSDYYKAVRNEAVKYFTSPDMTAEDASKAVQRAAQAYLARNY